MAGGIEGDYFVGKDIDRVRGLLKLTYPMEHGIGVIGNDETRFFLERNLTFFVPSLYSR